MDSRVKGEINGINLEFITESSLFSPRYIDRGTLCMLEEVDFTNEKAVLDLGCGYGVVGITAASFPGERKIVMVDVSDKAVEYTKQNITLNGFNVKEKEDEEGIEVFQSDGFENIQYRDFSIILSNPPYHTDFSVAKRFIEGAKRHLAIGGRLILVTKRKEWYKRKMISVFGGVKIIEKDGYFIFSSTRYPVSRKKGNE